MQAFAASTTTRFDISLFRAIDATTLRSFTPEWPFGFFKLKFQSVGTTRTRASFKTGTSSLWTNASVPESARWALPSTSSSSIKLLQPIRATIWRRCTPAYHLLNWWGASMPPTRMPHFRGRGRPSTSQSCHRLSTVSSEREPPFRFRPVAEDHSYTIITGVSLAFSPRRDTSTGVAVSPSRDIRSGLAIRPSCDISTGLDCHVSSESTWVGFTTPPPTPTHPRYPAPYTAIPSLPLSPAAGSSSGLSPTATRAGTIKSQSVGTTRTLASTRTGHSSVWTNASAPLTAWVGFAEKQQLRNEVVAANRRDDYAEWREVELMVPKLQNRLIRACVGATAPKQIRCSQQAQQL